MVKHTASYTEAHPDRVKGPARAAGPGGERLVNAALGESAVLLSLLGAVAGVVTLVVGLVKGRAEPGAGRAQLHVGDPPRRGHRHHRHAARPDRPRLHPVVRRPQRQPGDAAAVPDHRHVVGAARAPSCCGRSSSPGYLAAVAFHFRKRIHEPARGLGHRRRLRRRRLLLRADADRVQPVRPPPDRSRPTAPAPTRCCRTTSWWRSTRRILYLGLVGFTVPFCLRRRQPHHRSGRRGVDGRDPAVDAVRVGVPLRWHRPRGVVELPGPRLGRLLGVGSGGKCRLHPLADRHRLPPLGHGPATARACCGSGTCR